MIKDKSIIAVRNRSNLKSYIRIARIDHWFKNIFMLPGIALAMLFVDTVSYRLIGPMFIGILSTCLIASANYVINEWLDAASDKHHPIKNKRPSVAGNIQAKYVYFEYALLVVFGLGLAYQVSYDFLAFSVLLLIMGIVYNVKPIRTKDRIYLDVLSESINNPIRLMLGWSIVVSNMFPPSSILLAYWMGGAFLMGVKRYAEYRAIGDNERAGLYRRSFKFYSEQKLLLSIFFYALSSSFFLGIFLIKYRIEFLLTFPLFALLFTWYLAMGMRPNSATQDPEKLYKEPGFMSYLILLCTAVGLLFVIDLPWLQIFLNRIDY